MVNRRHSSRRVPLWRIAAQLEAERRHRVQRPERHRGIRLGLAFQQEAGQAAVSKLHLPSSVREALGQVRADEVRAGGFDARDLRLVEVIERVRTEQMPQEVGVQGEPLECRIARNAHFGGEERKSWGRWLVADHLLRTIVVAPCLEFLRAPSYICQRASRRYKAAKPRV